MRSVVLEPEPGGIDRRFLVRMSRESRVTGARIIGREVVLFYVEIRAQHTNFMTEKRQFRAYRIDEFLTEDAVYVDVVVDGKNVWVLVEENRAAADPWR